MTTYDLWILIGILHYAAVLTHQPYAACGFASFHILHFMGSLALYLNGN